MANIDDTTLDHLYRLARIEPEKNESKREKLLRDLSAVLNHFDELQEVDTAHVEPLAGGSFLSDISREDVKSSGVQQTDESLLKGQFSDQENGYLKTPPVF